jgi:hypothetical protein
VLIRQYIKMITEDPSKQEPGMPPALALSVRIKYPDIYNRFRKIRGSVKENKPSRSGKGRSIKSTRENEFVDPTIDPSLADAGPSNSKHEYELNEKHEYQLDDHDPIHAHARVSSGSGSVSRERSNGAGDDGPSMLQSEDVDHQFDQHLAQLASDGQLAEALLQLPQGANDIDGPSHAGAVAQTHGQPIGVGSGSGVVIGEGIPLHGHDDEDNLREAVLRMARAERDDWDSIVQP